MENMLLVLCTVLICATSINAYWGTPGTSQYHIQTDEGPERYFRYQTDNGQFRKEKRLADGTVIGTEAWIDASGYLRQKDYIADTQGYRILKAKTVFVGVNRPIQEAMKEAKKTQPQSGTLLKSNLVPVIEPIVHKKYYAPLTVTTTQAPPSTPNYLSSNPFLYPSPQNIYIKTHSQPIESAYIPAINYNSISSSTEKPIHDTSLEPPYNDYYSSTTPKITTNEPSSTLTPFSYDPTPISADSLTSKQPDFYSITSTQSYPSSISITPRPVNYNTIDYNNINSPVSSKYVPRVSIESTTPQSLYQYSEVVSVRPNSQNYIEPIDSSTAKPIINNNLDKHVQPLYSRPIVPREKLEPYSGIYSYNNRNRNSINQANREWNEQQLQPGQTPYDGVSVTNNGFKYFLPRHYHEEQNSDSSHRVGSFGYIDPFGIRRVSYYNTSPEGGFNLRHNNRYVGFKSTPYDPRPT